MCEAYTTYAMILLSVLTLFVIYSG